VTVLDPGNSYFNVLMTFTFELENHSLQVAGQA
jgi:hypothetical protein